MGTIAPVLALAVAAFGVHGAARAPPIELTAVITDAFAARYGAEAGDRLREWGRLMRERAHDADARKRAVANDFFNRIPWLSDEEHWGVRDYWATRFEMIGTNGGDCED